MSTVGSFSVRVGAEALKSVEVVKGLSNVKHLAPILSPDRSAHLASPIEIEWSGRMHTCSIYTGHMGPPFS